VYDTQCVEHGVLHANMVPTKTMNALQCATVLQHSTVADDGHLQLIIVQSSQCPVLKVPSAPVGAG
jgi:hypothetical protein